MQRDWRKDALIVGAGVAIAAGLWWAFRKTKERGYDLRGKTVLITGGSRGLGLVLARELAKHGARLALCARDADELERARADLADRGADVEVYTCDVSDPLAVETMVGRVTDDFAQIDALINNAGVIAVGPVDEMTLEDFELAMGVNFWGPLHCTRAVLPHMKRRGEGRIVNISSIGGKVPLPHLVPYTASKFALVGLSEGMRAELVKDGVTVTTVCPGLMRTGSPRNILVKGRHREEYAWFSVSDSLPGMSMAAPRAARHIIAAMRRGDAELILSLPAKVAALIHGVAPGFTARAAGMVNRALPRPGGIGEGHARGHESQSKWSPSRLTRLSDRAAEENNEFPGSPPEASGEGA